MCLLTMSSLSSAEENQGEAGEGVVFVWTGSRAQEKPFGERPCDQGQPMEHLATLRLIMERLY